MWHVDLLTAVGRPTVTGVPAHPRQLPREVFRQFLDDTVHDAVATAGGSEPLVRLRNSACPVVIVPASCAEHLAGPVRRPVVLPKGVLPDRYGLGPR